TGFGVSLRPERQEYRQPQPSPGAPPGGQTLLQQIKPLLRSSFAGNRPALEDLSARLPEWKAMLAPERDDHAGVGSHVLGAPATDVQHAAGMASGIDQRMRMR